MTQRIAVWHGTDQDFVKLQVAVKEYCDCVVVVGNAGNGTVPYTCPGHAMLADQDTLNHFAFVGVNREAYWHGEFDPASEWF